MEEMIAQCTQMMSQMNAMSGGGMMGSGMMGGMMGMPGAMAGVQGGMAGAMASPWYWLGWVTVLGALAFLIVGFAWAVRGLRRPASAVETPLAILQRRFARGEVSSEQYEAIKRQLSH